MTLIEFLIKAKTSTYADGTKYKVESTRSNSIDYHYEEDSFKNICFAYKDVLIGDKTIVNINAGNNVNVGCLVNNYEVGVDSCIKTKGSKIAFATLHTLEILPLNGSASTEPTIVYVASSLSFKWSPIQE